MTTEFKIRQWAKERGLLINPKPLKQFAKMIEECGEIAECLTKNNTNNLPYELGDVAVTLIILAAQHDLYLEECLEMAYKKIESRSGRTIDGTFIKQEDL